MAGKQGTLLGRTLLKFIPEHSPFHAIAEAVDKTIESVVFDSKKGEEVPVLEHHTVTDFKDTAKALFLAAADQGIISINWPVVDGDQEKAVEEGLNAILEAYVDEILGDDEPENG